MTVLNEPAKRALAHVVRAVVAAFAAGVSACFLSALVGLVGSSSGDVWAWLRGIAEFGPRLGIAGVIFFAPVHLLAQRFVAPSQPRLARWAHAAPAVLFAYLLHGLAGALSTQRMPDFDVAGFATICAFVAPAVFIFDFAVNRIRRLPVGWLLGALALVWLAAYLAAPYGVPGTQSVKFHPLAAADVVIKAWHQTGRAAMFFAGVAALALWQLRMPRVAAGMFAVGIALPMAFAGWHTSIPLGDGYTNFDLGPRTVRIHWQRQPFTYDGGLNFNIADLEPYRIAGRRALNKNLQVRPAIGRLVDRRQLDALPVASHEHSGLTCHNIRFKNRPVTLCGQPGLPETWTTEVWNEHGWAHQTFDHDGVRYSLHYDVEDIPKWRDIERAAIAALNDVDASRK